MRRSSSLREVENFEACWRTLWRASVPALPANACRSFVSVNQLGLYGVVCEFGVGLHAQLLKEAGAVGADGSVAQVQKLGDFAGGLARRDEAHDFKLAV